MQEEHKEGDDGIHSSDQFSTNPLDINQEESDDTDESFEHLEIDPLYDKSQLKHTKSQPANRLVVWTHRFHETLQNSLQTALFAKHSPEDGVLLSIAPRYE